MQGGLKGAAAALAPGKSKNNRMLWSATAREVPSIQGLCQDNRTLQRWTPGPGTGFVPEPCCVGGTRELGWVCGQQQGNKMCLSLQPTGACLCSGLGSGRAASAARDRVLPLVFASQSSPSQQWGLAGSRQHKEAGKGLGQFWESHSDAVNWVQNFGRQSSPLKAGTSQGGAQCVAVHDVLLSCGSRSGKQ